MDLGGSPLSSGSNPLGLNYSKAVAASRPVRTRHRGLANAGQKVLAFSLLNHGRLSLPLSFRTADPLVIVYLPNINRRVLLRPPPT